MLDDETLHASAVVANCAMNRERRCVGSNGYSYELNCDLIAFLESRRSRKRVRWLDVCCGSGLAIAEAAAMLEGDLSHFCFEGIDLAGHFAVSRSSSSGRTPAKIVLRKTSFESWTATQNYDLVTCVHGLHYIGDKLGTIARMVNCLADDGVFIANVDLNNFRFENGRSAGRSVAKCFNDAGISYDKRHRLIRCEGRKEIDTFGMTYVGANDQAGPNYTGQPAVHSVYQKDRRSDSRS